MTDTIADAHAQALAALERALREPAAMTVHDLEAANRCVVRLRDALIARIRDAPSEAEAHAALDQTNAALSLVVGAQYPIVGLHRERIQSARNALASVRPPA